VDAFGPVKTGASGAAPAVVGDRLFAQYCGVCHGKDGAGGGGGPDLTASALRDRAALVAFLKAPKPPMPRFYPDPFGEAEVSAVADHVVGLQRDAAAARH
jgi:mono/diheme cytochrome c family protein